MRYSLSLLCHTYPKKQNSSNNNNCVIMEGIFIEGGAAPLFLKDN